MALTHNTTVTTRARRTGAGITGNLQSNDLSGCKVTFHPMTVTADATAVSNRVDFNLPQGCVFAVWAPDVSSEVASVTVTNPAAGGQLFTWDTATGTDYAGTLIAWCK